MPEAYSGTFDLETSSSVNESNSPATQLHPESFRLAYEAWQEAKRNSEAWATIAETRKADLVALLGHAETGMVGNKVIMRYRRVERRTVGGPMLRERYPELYDQCSRVSQSMRLDTYPDRLDGLTQ